MDHQMNHQNREDLLTAIKSFLDVITTSKDFAASVSDSGLLLAAECDLKFSLKFALREAYVTSLMNIVQSALVDNYNDVEFINTVEESLRELEESMQFELAQAIRDLSKDSSGHISSLIRNLRIQVLTEYLDRVGAFGVVHRYLEGKL